ncbi:hypothetical protein Tco_1220903 [Tanacetum coccineum]
MTLRFLANTSVLLLHFIERRDEMRKIRLDHLKQDQEMLVIKIFGERKKVVEVVVEMVVKVEVLIEKKRMCSLGLMRFDLWMEFLMVHLEELEMKKLLWEKVWLKEENPRRRGKVYNWETATYGKIWDNEDVHDLESVETEFPSIVFNDTLTFEATLSSEPTISSLNNDEIDFRVSFDESDDEDCTPTVSYFDDLDYFKDFEKEFPAVVYNDALTSKLDFLTEPTVSPQHIDEYNLKDETSLSECDEEEQNILIFNDLPF